MNRPMTTVESALAAEVRAVEEGHRARWDDSRRCYSVKSETDPLRSYDLCVEAVIPATFPIRPIFLRFDCSCPAGEHADGMRPVPCKHAALVARRLERERLARWDGAYGWLARGRLLRAALADDGEPVGVFIDAPGHPDTDRAAAPITDTDILAEQIRSGL